MQLTWNKTGSNKCDGAPRLNPIREGDNYSRGLENMFQQSERNEV